MLFILFFGLLAGAAPAIQQQAVPDTCYEAAAASEIAVEHIQKEWETGHFNDSSLRALSNAAREAWTCFLPYSSEVAGMLFRQDIYALRYLDAFHELLQVTERYSRKVSGAEDPATMSYLFYQRGNVYAQLADPLRSMRAYSRALEYAEALDPLKRSELLMNVAVAKESFNDFEGSLALYERAEVLLEDAVKNDPATYRRPLADLLMRKADVLNMLSEQVAGEDGGSSERPLQAARKAAAIYAQLDLSHLVGMALVEEAEALSALGRTDEALAAAREALRLSKATPHEPLKIAARQKLALVLMELDRLGEAEQYMLQALQWTDDINRYDYRKAITSNLGFIYELRGQPRKAEHWYGRSLTAFRKYRESLGLSRWSLGTLNASAPAHRGLARVLLETGRVQEAFLLLNRSRARYLYDLKRHARLLGQRSTEVRRKADSLSKRLVELRTASVAAAPGSEMDRTASELALLLDMPARPPTVFLPALQNQLEAENRVLLSYFIDDTEHIEASYVFVLTADLLRAVPLAVTADSIRALLKAVSPLFSEAAAPVGMSAMRFNLKPLHRLYTLLFAPIEAFVPARAPVTIIPDEPLYKLPFAMLVQTPVDPYGYREADYLLRRHPITIDASAAHLPLQNEAGETFPHDVVALGKSNFSSSNLDDAELPTPVISYAFRSDPYFDLPAVAGELVNLTSYFNDVLYRLDARATETFLYEHMNAGRILHIASHAIADRVSPLQSTIILSPDTSHDGLVHLYELQGRALRAPLVVLSSCNSARGKRVPGEGVLGLHYGFRALGAQSLIATRWPVDDRAFATLIGYFYQELASGLGKAEALRQAQLAYLESAPASALSPFFWAAPMLYGDPSALTFQRASLLPAWSYGVAGFLLFGILILIIYRKRTSRASSSPV